MKYAQKLVDDVYQLWAESPTKYDVKIVFDVFEALEREFQEVKFRSKSV